MITRETVATETPARRATSFIVAIQYLLIWGKRLHVNSVAEKWRAFKGSRRDASTNVTQTTPDGVIVTRRLMSKPCDSEPLVTLCLRLLRLSDSRVPEWVDRVEIPEVLIGGINSG
ncbi:hypothetical protein A6J71_05390 [Enterobacter cancerogenus]|nr:hypothetical protein CWI88_04320 [Enterobacter cancerogenus]PNF09621.1 hypothetical protein A6J71_05390 [Enterobacter cancerogenus]